MLNNIFIVLLGVVFAVYMGSRIIPRILVISFRKRLFDVPDARKVHKRPIPRLGGVTFYPVLFSVFSLLTAYRIMVGDLPNEVFTADFVTEILCMFAGLTLLYIIGIGDDLVGVRYINKFKVQILSATLFPIAGLYINNFYGLLGIHELTPYVGVPLTILLVVFITNAINLIDGIDGLASSICIVALSVFGILFINHGLWMFAHLAFICVGILIPFFIYNVFGNADRGRKIFMGDTGSLTMGYVLSFFVIKYCMYTGPQSLAESDAPIIIAFSILFVPCLDVIRVVLGRVRRGKSPFLPDRTHIHHKFMDMGFTPRTSLVLIQGISLCFIIGSFLMSHYGVDVNIVFLLNVIVWTGINIWFSKLIAKK